MRIHDDRTIGRKISADKVGFIYYGWVIVATCTLLISITFGICFSFGVFISSLQAEFSWSRATASSLFSLYLFFVGVFSIIGGRLCDELGPKIVVLMMGVISGLSLVLTSQVKFAWQLYLTYSLLLSMGTGAMYIVVMSTASRWFSNHRAGALGIIGAGASLGTVIMAPFSAWMISLYQWRNAYLIMGIIAWVMIIPLSLLLKKNPRRSDLRSESQTLPAVAGMENQESAAMSLSTAIKTRHFRLLLLSWFSYSFCLFMVMGHVVPAIEDHGAAPFRAAAVLSLVAAVNIPSRLISGFVADLVDKSRVVFGFAMLMALSMFWLSWADQVWKYYVFAVAFGIAYGGIDPPLTALVGDVFGLSRVGEMMGALMVGWGTGSAVGPYIGGLFFDYTGTYRPAFLAGGVIILLTVIYARGPGKNTDY